MYWVNNQTGFRSTYSTVDNLFCLQAIVTKYLRQKGGRLYAILVDFEKAFGRIDRKFFGVNSCSISPILLSFFLNDLKDYVTVYCNGLDLQMCKVFLLLFADDLVIFADSKVELQRLINNLASYCKTFKLKVNMRKTNIIVFRNGGYLRSYEKWYFESIPIKVITYYKYLGLVLSSSCLGMHVRKRSMSKHQKHCLL